LSARRFEQFHLVGHCHQGFLTGPLGFEKDRFTVSQTPAERVLLPAVRTSSHDTILVSKGFSCREQIKQNTPRNAVHLSEALAGSC
jgi:hypothetical protein